MSTIMIGTRVAPEVAEQLRDRAEQQDSTVSRIAAGILRRSLASDKPKTAGSQIEDRA